MHSALRVGLESVEGEARGGDLLLPGSFLAHRRRQQVRDAGAGLARAEQEHALVADALPGEAQRGQDPRDGDARRALDVVVEAGDPVLVALEQPEGVVLVEVLPLHDGAGEDLGDRLHERLDEVVVVLPGDAA